MDKVEEKHNFGNSEYMRFVHETLIPHQTQTSKEVKEKENTDEKNPDTID